MGFYEPMSKADEQTVQALYRSVQLTRPLLRHITAAVEATLASTGISVGQRAILEGLLLAGQDCSLPDLTARLQLKRQFVHKMLGAGTAAGWIRTHPHPTRKNGHHYQLTENGRRAIQSIRAAEIVAVAKFSENVDPADLDSFIRVQAALNRFFADMAQMKVPGVKSEGEET